MVFWFWVQAAVILFVTGLYFMKMLPDKLAKKVVLWLGGEWDDSEK